MEPDIINKIRNTITEGITSEKDVAYLLVEIRKYLDLTENKENFEFLNFHCDWALHIKMDRRFARHVLQLVERGHQELLAGKELNELSSTGIDWDKVNLEDLETLTPDNDSEVSKLLTFKRFRTELIKFLEENSLPNFIQSEDDWIRFVYLYSCIIQDCPLMLPSERAGPTSVMKINVVSKHVFDEPSNQDMYNITLSITDAIGNTGDVFLINGILRE